MEKPTSDGVGVLPDPIRSGELAKTLTGIRGLDEITRGGLPKGRPTLVCGGPGSGKTLLALTFLVNGAALFDEPGVLMTFEENVEEIAGDVASLGFDLPELVKAGKLAVDYVRVERSEIEETGEYDLEGLFVRLDYAIQSVGATRYKSADAQTHGHGRRQPARDVRPWSQAHFLPLGSQHDAGAGSAADRRALCGTVPSAEQAADHRTGSGADADLGRVLTLRGWSHVGERRGLHGVFFTAALQGGEAERDHRPALHTV
jgi:hypothetical protein